MRNASDIGKPDVREHFQRQALLRRPHRILRRLGQFGEVSIDHRELEGDAARVRLIDKQQIKTSGNTGANRYRARYVMKQSAVSRRNAKPRSVSASSSPAIKQAALQLGDLLSPLDPPPDIHEAPAEIARHIFMHETVERSQLGNALVKTVRNLDAGSVASVPRRPLILSELTRRQASSDNRSRLCRATRRIF